MEQMKLDVESQERLRKEHHTLREDNQRLKQSHQHLEEHLEIAQREIADIEAQLDHISRTKDGEIEALRQQLQDKVKI